MPINTKTLINMSAAMKGISRVGVMSKEVTKAFNALAKAGARAGMRPGHRIAVRHLDIGECYYRYQNTIEVGMMVISQEVPNKTMIRSTIGSDESVADDVEVEVMSLEVYDRIEQKERDADNYLVYYV